MNKRHYEHTLPNIRGSLSNTYITSLSIDWEMVGNEAANFVLNNVPIQKYMPTEVRLRKSL